MAKRHITNAEMKKNNRNRIFRYMCKYDKISNPDISYELKMSLPMVTQNTKELMERGLVVEAGELESTGGRRAKAISVDFNSKLAIGLGITRNHVGLVLTNLAGEVLKYDRSYQPYQNSESYYHEVDRKLDAFLRESGMERGNILGIGISFPGIVNCEKEEITYSHVLDLEHVSFASVSRFFSYPCYFLNDANAGAYAEGIHSDSSERFFYLSLSNSVGGAIFSRGELIQGKDFRCGEVGHMTVVTDGAPCYCGKRGCLDAYCCAKRLSELTDGKLEAFFEGLGRGEADKMKVWDRYTTYLSAAINNIYMILDCDIILGGYVGGCINEHIRDVWEKVEVLNTFGKDSSFVKPCTYKIEAAALGAALQVIEIFVENV